jgi:hypothetical protein
MESVNVNQLTGYKVVELKKAFKEINRIVFNNELPTIPIKLDMHKQRLGSSASDIKKRGDELTMLTPREIHVSKFLEFDAEIVYGILVHEMVHLRIATNFAKDIADGKKPTYTAYKKFQLHGADFKKIASMAAKKLGTYVPVDEAVSKIRKVRSTGKMFYAVMMVDKDGEAGHNKVLLLTKAAYQNALDNKESFNVRMNFVKKRDSYKEMIFGTTKFSELAKYTASRNLKSLSIVKVDGILPKDFKVDKKL